MDFSDLPAGTLTDRMINGLCKNNLLIIDNFESKNIKQACYELRASDIYYCPLTSDVRQPASQSGYILIKPKQLVIIIAQEELCLPPDIMARILTKGKLFSIGLSAVNTYADSGFEGRLGIVFINMSNNYLKITPGESIAKIEFCKLTEPVIKPYKGQHGYDSKMWPLPKELIATPEELSIDARVYGAVEEATLSYGEGIGEFVRRVFVFERRLFLFSIAYFLFTMMILIFLYTRETDVSKLSEQIIAAGVGVAASLIASTIVYWATIKRGKK